MNWGDVSVSPLLRPNSGVPGELFSHNYCRSLDSDDEGAWCFREDALRTRVSEDEKSGTKFELQKI